MFFIYLLFGYFINKSVTSVTSIIIGLECYLKGVTVFFSDLIQV